MLQASGENRTPNLSITNATLCQLSYAGARRKDEFGYTKASGENRTPNLSITNATLCQLSYAGLQSNQARLRHILP